MVCSADIHISRTGKLKIMLIGIIISVMLSSCVTKIIDDETAGPVDTPFTGEPGQVYEFIWTEGRDREWEEDVVQLAELLLRTHPLFTASEVQVTTPDVILGLLGITDRMNFSREMFFCGGFER